MLVSVGFVLGANVETRPSRHRDITSSSEECRELKSWTSIGSARAHARFALARTTFGRIVVSTRDHREFWSAALGPRQARSAEA